MKGTPQDLAPNESDTYRTLIVRYLAILETHRPENRIKPVPIEEARKILKHLAGVSRLTTDDRDVINKVIKDLTVAGVSAIDNDW